MKISPYQHRILDAIARGVAMDVAALYAPYVGLTTGQREVVNGKVRERVRKALGEAHGLGWSARDVLPEERETVGGAYKDIVDLYKGAGPARR